MALTTNKKNKIIAEWKAGLFKSYYAVAKHYKITQETAKKILLNITQSNTDIVAAGVMYETSKKLTKNLVEVKAIEKAVKELSIADQVEAEAFSATLENIRSVRKKIQLEEVDNMQDHRHAQATIDQALISVGKAARHAPRAEVKLTGGDDNSNTNNLTIEQISVAIANGLPN